PDSSSKADKKFDKKVQFYAKVRDTVASLTAKKDITKLLEKLDIERLDKEYFRILTRFVRYRCMSVGATAKCGFGVGFGWSNNTKIFANELVYDQKKKLRSRQKKLKAYDLSALSEFLPELKAPRANDFKLNCKSRQQLILKEGKQLSAVLEHPAFQADPLAAIHQHLQNTQPVLDEKPKKKKNQNGGRKKKSKKLKALSRQQSMDI
ncbi:hypothetical protein Gotur_007174, partial [Gossypium turneri]